MRLVSPTISSHTILVPYPYPNLFVTTLPGQTKELHQGGYAPLPLSATLLGLSYYHSGFQDLQVCCGAPCCSK